MPKRVRPRKTPLPLAAYLRLTQDRDGNKIGYDVQKKEIEEWSRATGVPIGAWYRDNDTAADPSVEREGYEQMLADLESGLWGGIIVWRIDRLVRRSREYQRCVNIVEDAGGYIVSLAPRFNTSNPIEKMVLHLLVMIAEQEIESMRIRRIAHLRSKAMAGHAHAGGPRPYGFVGAVKDADGVHLNRGAVGVQHVPEEIANLRSAARRIAWEEESWTDVVDDWNSSGVPTVTGVSWSVQTLQRCLTGPRAIGVREVPVYDGDGDLVETLQRPAVWEPVIDQRTYERLRSKLNPIGKRGPQEQYLLSGIATCGRCGHTLIGCRRQYRVRGEPVVRRTYRCPSGPAGRERGACGKLSVLSDPIELMAKAAIVTLVERTDQIKRTVPEGAESTSSELDRQLAKALATMAEIDDQLVTNARAKGAGTMLAAEWQAERVVLMERREATERIIERLAGRLTTVPMPTGRERDDIAGWYDALNLSRRRKLIIESGLRVAIRATGRSGPRFDPTRVVITLPDPE